MYCIELFISMNHDGFKLPARYLGERQMKITGSKIRNTYYCKRNMEILFICLVIHLHNCKVHLFNVKGIRRQL